MGGWGMSQKCETFKPLALYVLLPVLTLSNHCSIDCLCAKYRFITKKGLTVSRGRGIQAHAFRVTYDLRCYWALISPKGMCWLLACAEHPSFENSLISDIGHSNPRKNRQYCINLLKLNIYWWHWDSQTTPIVSFVLFAHSVCTVILPYRRHWRTTWRILFIGNFLLFPQSEMKQLVALQEHLCDHKHSSWRQSGHGHNGSVLSHRVLTSL